MAMLKNIFLFILILGLAGCQSLPTYVAPAAPARQNVPGVYHQVKPGQTLWKISKIYNVDLDDIVRLNQLSVGSKIEIGQMVFVPSCGEQTIKSVVKYDSSEDFVWPLKGKVISGFGANYRNIVNKGINLSPYSSTNVVASRAGKVVFYGGALGNFGKTVIIDHGDGLRSVYSRNSEVYVKIGDVVKQGELIAKVGCTKRDKFVYLHFEIRKGVNPQNPLFYLL